VVAVDVPQAVVDLLTDMHEFPHRSVLSKQQLEDRKQRQMEQTAPVESTASAAIDAILKANACNMAVAGTGQGQAVEDEASRPNEQQLKRKQVPTGTMYVLSAFAVVKTPNRSLVMLLLPTETNLPLLC